MSSTPDHTQLYRLLSTVVKEATIASHQIGPESWLYAGTDFWPAVRKHIEAAAEAAAEAAEMFTEKAEVP